MMMLTRKISVPSRVMRAMGFVERDVMPSQAKDSIFFSGYLEVPAKRSFRA